jgi:DNA-binding NarL/FixJ family response regulator
MERSGSRREGCLTVQELTQFEKTAGRPLTVDSHCGLQNAQKGCRKMLQPNIVIADDHALVIDAFRSLLEPEYKVVGSATDGQQLLAVAQRLKPDVILVDIELPLLNGAAAGEKLKQLLPRTKLIVVTVHDDVDVAGHAMRHWASAYVLKTSAATELTRAVREVLKGSTYLTPSMAKRLSDEFVRNPHVDRQRTLTPRQREVLQLLAEGRTMIDAANLLRVTPRTLAFHKYRIMEEFGLKNNSQLVLLAIKERLRPPLQRAVGHRTAANSNR